MSSATIAIGVARCAVIAVAALLHLGDPPAATELGVIGLDRPLPRHRTRRHNRLQFQSRSTASDLGFGNNHLPSRLHKPFSE